MKISRVILALACTISMILFSPATTVLAYTMGGHPECVHNPADPHTTVYFLNRFSHGYDEEYGGYGMKDWYRCSLCGYEHYLFYPD